ncbi:MAG: flagellar brake protein [Rhodoferax sp.]
MDEKQTLPPEALEEPDPSTMSNDLAALEDFRVTHPKVICDVLRQLMSRKDFLTVESNNGPHRIVTRILAVDQAGGQFIYDGSADKFHNRSLLDAQENYFSATQDGIRIQFVGSRPEQHEFEGGFAFRAPLPQSLYRVQRREFFRAAAPLVESYCCIAILPDKRKAMWDIVDLSLDGLGLRSKDPTLADLPLDTLLTRVALNFGKRGSIETDLRITNLRNIRSASNPVYRIGGRFERFPKSKEQEFQRMITYLELARRGRAEGAVTKDSGFY